MDLVSLEKVVKPANSSFIAVLYQNAYFAAPLHIHPEYELISIEDGIGLSFVGDSVHKMSKGDFMLIGRNLPHLWLSADEYYETDTKLMSKSVYSQFNTDIFPAEYAKVPEFASINLLLHKSQRGLLFVGDSRLKIQDRFRKLPLLDNFEKLLELYEILYELSLDDNYSFLTTTHYRGSLQMDEDDLILKRAYNYINKFYQEEISLADIAQNVGMNASALCRYFKKNTGTTLFEYLSKLRISYAVKLLSNRNIAINQIAYDCGYNNLSHFNRQFKSITGKTPSEYCRLIRSEKVLNDE
jgi:AraC-like DNA-binding protein